MTPVVMALHALGRSTGLPDSARSTLDIDIDIDIESSGSQTIFEEFEQQGLWLTSEFGGLGLGLAIATFTVKAHHGTLTAASGGRNRGATFTVPLPMR